jgi:beta-glucosidase
MQRQSRSARRVGAVAGAGGVLAVVAVTAAAVLPAAGAAVRPTGRTAAPAGGSASVKPDCLGTHFRRLPLAKARRDARKLLDRMTLPQEDKLLHGVGLGTAPAGTVGATAPIKTLHIPALTQQDGPGGVGDNVGKVTQLPAPEALAGTFDRSAARCYGQVIGHEERRKGVNVVYGPTVNLVRVPQWGRAFESLGEDPDLTGALAAAEVHGIQSAGTMAQVKHYTAYNQETNRNTRKDDALVGTKALQEIYLRPWDQILRAEPSSVMCSYATVDGHYACQDRRLMRGYLDHTLHFSGFIGSDYYATHSTVASIKAGLDQEQPERKYFGKALMKDVREGTVKRSLVDHAVLRILTQMYRFRVLTDDTTGNIHADVASARDNTVARSIAEESTTLLQNNGILPLASTGGPVAVIGPAGKDSPVSVGDGSATVTAPRVVTPYAGLRAALSKRDITYTDGQPRASKFTTIPSEQTTKPFPAKGTKKRFRTRITPQGSGTYEFAYTEPDDYSAVTLSLDGKRLVTNPGTPPNFRYVAAADLQAGKSYTLTLSGPAESLTWATDSAVRSAIASAVTAAGSAAAAVVVVGDDQESEAADRVDLALPGAQNQLIRAVASANSHTVVVVDAGGPVAMPWLGDVAAVVDTFYPGQADGRALASILTGATDPSGHLPMTFPQSLRQSPTHSKRRFPGEHSKVHYSEGVDIGYRWYDAKRLTPLFPFGYGLSYTSFRYSRPAVTVSRSGHRPPVVTVEATVTNTGTRSGADVAQLYLRQPGSAHEPPRQLAGFHRVGLRPGASRRLTWRLHGLVLGHWSKGEWRVARGQWKAFVGDSSAPTQLPAQVTFRIRRAATLTP